MSKNIRILVDNLDWILESKNPGIYFNPVLNNINQNRYLGSSNQCYKLLYEIARFLDVQKVLEIGTHKGASAITFAQSIIDNELIPDIHTVDNWSQASLFEDAKDNIKRSGFNSYITMYEGDSLNLVPEIFKKIGKVDLVFIDGNHNSEYVIKDFNNCKDNSDFIILHDTEDGDLPYVKYIKSCDFDFYNFPTRYIEGDGHLVGLGLAIKMI